jgi:hypothetical protein
MLTWRPHVELLAVEHLRSVRLAPQPHTATSRGSLPLLLPLPQGCKAIICMPMNTPDIKVSNVRRLGGEVCLVGESYQEAQAHAQARAAAEGLVFVAPYDDPYTIAGQGTIADEIMRQVRCW